MVSRQRRHAGGIKLTYGAGEYLEWIVIVLIAAEIIVAIINIVVDLYAGVD
jgi:uncharacterized Rmd1/YagE family protein